MDIRNIGEFTGYCQQHAEDTDLPNIIDFADLWTDFSVRLGKQYGGHGQGMDEWVDEAYRRMKTEGVTISQEQLAKTHEILTRFWEHGEAFDKWFQSKVVIVKK